MVNECPECYASQKDIVLWREQPMNEELRAYVQTYISRPKLYLFTLDRMLQQWGEDFNQEDYPE